jgi:hypothetical protein
MLRAMAASESPGVPSVQELLARLGLRADDGEHRELPHNRRLTPGVWRVRLDDGRSAVLKYLPADRDPGATPWDAHWTANDHDPRRWNYWAREPLAYREGVTEVFARAGLHAPTCLGVSVDERDAVLLLEWVDAQLGESWPVEFYGPAAEALGRAQAPFLLGEPLPPYPWLSRTFLRQYSSEKPVEWQLFTDDEVWQHPIAREVFPSGLREGVLFVHANRDRLYRISESLPRTLCHLDVWPKNLLREADGRLVLIDWAFIGVGSVGEDVGNLVPDACFDHFIPARELPRLEQVIFNAYLDGLRSAGWTEDPRLVQLGMWSSAVKYDWLAALTLAQLRHDTQYRYGGEGEIDPVFKFRERAQGLHFLTNWARDAIELADELGL